MHKLLAPLLLAAGPALGWEVTLGPVCTLIHDTSTAQIALTYDPAAPLYTLTVTRKDEVWSAFPVFAMAFAGPNALSISTDRHTLSADGTALTVSDQGFGNVLDGLQYNTTAAAFLGDGREVFPLTDAAPAVKTFRDCAPSAGV